MKRTVPVVLLACVLQAQVPTNVNLQSPVPPAPVASVNVVGNQGGAVYTYWVVVNYAGGAVVGQGRIVQRAPVVLTVSNFVNIGWTALPGAVTYDVVRTTLTDQFTGSCSACAVATGLTEISTVDNGGMLTDYSMGTAAPPGFGVLYVNNRDYAPAQIRQIVNGLDTQITGGSMTLSKTVHVTAAQIRAMQQNVVGLELIPLVPGKTIIPSILYVEFSPGNTPYSDGSDLRVGLGSAAAGVSVAFVAFNITGVTDNEIGLQNSFDPSTVLGMDTASGYKNQPVSLLLAGGTQYVDGDGTLDITVWYVVTP